MIKKVIVRCKVALSHQTTTYRFYNLRFPRRRDTALQIYKKSLSQPKKSTFFKTVTKFHELTDSIAGSRVNKSQRTVKVRINVDYSLELPTLIMHPQLHYLRCNTIHRLNRVPFPISHNFDFKPLKFQSNISYRPTQESRSEVTEIAKK